MKYVYVVGFSPAVDSGNGTGGFDWAPKFKVAVKLMKQRLSEGKGYNLALTKVRVPDNLSPADITTFIDSRLNLVEVTVQPDIEVSEED